MSYLEQGAAQGASMVAVPASCTSSNLLCKPHDICVTYLPAWDMKWEAGKKEHYAFPCEGKKSLGVRYASLWGAVMGADKTDTASIF